jgi:ATP-binding cassette subfamily C (CFTR/MRP) protein 1
MPPSFPDPRVKLSSIPSDLSVVTELANPNALVDRSNRSEHTLKDFNFKVKRGQLVAVVGACGGGKSSLLSALLGEMNLQSGRVQVAGSVAYCAQQPWILNDTVQGNILFGLPMEEERFTNALFASNLYADLEALSGGLQTQIGEKGANLSGGQRARIALARAIYKDADIYLLDDPLSAVDAHVGQHIFHECVKTVLSKKTRILVTHHVHLLSQCDLIMIVEDGAIKASGSYEHLKRHGVDIESYIPKELKRFNSVDGSEDGEPLGEYVPKLRATSMSFDLQESFKQTTLRPDMRANSFSKMMGLGVSTDSYKDHWGLRKQGSGKYAPDQSMSASTESGADNDSELINNCVSMDVLESGQVAMALEMRPIAAAITYTPQQQAAMALKNDTRTSTITAKEERVEGNVSLALYSFYIKAGGVYLFSWSVLFIMTSQVFGLLSSYWLSDWSDASNRADEKGEQLSADKNLYYVNYYALWSALSLITYVVRALILAEHRMGTSITLHEGLLKSVLGAPVSFFDVTPMGRVLNRFSSDIQTIDEDLSSTLTEVVYSLSNVLGVLGAIAVATKGTLLVLLVPLMYLYEKVQGYFRKTNTEIARLESISRSPIYADFSQALGGLSSIRVYQREEMFIACMEQKVDDNSIANITQQLASQWLAVRLSLLSSFVTFFIALIASVTTGLIPAGYLALGLAYSFQLTAYLKYCVRTTAQCEAQMNCVERVMHYTNNVQSEGGGPEEQPAESVPADWPSRGVISGSDIEMSYRDGPLVLKGLTFEVGSFEKIGVAGRTGSGKSSLMIGLFRIHELRRGCILIDGIDIATVPLPVLRSRLGIIPQDPAMFSASVRFNLDPFEQYSDEVVWAVLDSIGMKTYVQNLPARLREEVVEGGDSFSLGQRQLICIARAILRKPKILVLDEATASIDNETDALVQRTVREQFKDCTVLTIAHRLHTIIDSDKIMILDDGVLAEMDSPANLLLKTDGIFRGLWDKHHHHHAGIDHSVGATTSH